MWASAKGHVEAVKVLLQHGGDPNITATVSFVKIRKHYFIFVFARMGIHLLYLLVGVDTMRLQHFFSPIRHQLMFT